MMAAIWSEGFVPTAPSRRVRLALGIAFALAVSMQIAGLHDLRFDDAYITYRYAENLTRGRGPVFNPDQRVLGTTAPGHMLIAAAVHRVAGHERLPDAMAVLGCLGWAAQAAGAYRLLARALGWTAAAGAAGLVLAGNSGAAGFVALETNLVAAVALWSMVAARAGRWTLAGLGSGAAALLRPDAALVGAVLALDCWFATRDARRLARFFAVAALVVLPWVVFATLYYGSPIPQTAHAKIGNSAWGPWLRHLVRLPFAMPLQPLEREEVVVAALVGAGLCAAGARVLSRRDPRLWTLPAFGLAHLVAWIPMRSLIGHRWHLYPATLVATLLIGSAAGGWLAFAPRRGLRVAAACLLVALLAVGVAQTVVLAQVHPRSYWEGGRDCGYRAVADFLRPRVSAHGAVASVEVGTIAYWSDLEMVDLGGLVNTRRDVAVKLPSVEWVVVDRTQADRAAGVERKARFTCGAFEAWAWPVAQETVR